MSAVREGPRKILLAIQTIYLGKFDSHKFVSLCVKHCILFFGVIFYCIFVRFGKMTHLLNLKMCQSSSPGCPGGCGAPVYKSTIPKIMIDFIQSQVDGNNVGEVVIIDALKPFDVDEVHDHNFTMQAILRCRGPAAAWAAWA